MSDPDSERRDKAAQVHCRLLEAHGQPPRLPHLDAVSQLVNTILSQNTNDLNRDAAFRRLRAQFPTWEQVRDAPPEAVLAAIRTAGLANQKGPRIQQALRFITQERGQLNLDFLATWPTEKAKAWLSSINGVGPKTAAIVLLFSLGQPAFPVDTHVHRVSKRLGLIDPRVSREKAHDELERLVPEQDYYAFHLNVIAHGRGICTSRRPRCASCILQDLCDYYGKQPA